MKTETICQGRRSTYENRFRDAASSLCPWRRRLSLSQQHSWLTQFSSAPRTKRAQKTWRVLSDDEWKTLNLNFPAKSQLHNSSTGTKAYIRIWRHPIQPYENRNPTENSRSSRENRKSRSLRHVTNGFAADSTMWNSANLFGKQNTIN